LSDKKLYFSKIPDPEVFDSLDYVAIYSKTGKPNAGDEFILEFGRMKDEIASLRAKLAAYEELERAAEDLRDNKTDTEHWRRCKALWDALAKLIDVEKVLFAILADSK
jgi:hypothetical protein